ncbi:universal stress protein [Roseivivax sediminis]|uniref:Nucleotide-binding universal stress protein, UspA family n=1 Tax=Roseivivax sediminis TaxID=936889 RepID=A0A1I1VQN2_9RHOB|nr:universal stress protein [Roseivivax sediminis]SFD82820.1 Nucleotide-binding universal stress protein, UspA family [Roseivivax sediminis]
MRKILVCSDLSDRSHHALVRAAQLVRNHSASLIICSIVDDDLPPKMVDTLKRETAEGLTQACRSLGHDDAEIVVEVGEPVAAIMAIASRVDADMLVLGTHRHRPLWDLIYGTTMERLVHASRLPVLLVPNPVTAAYSRVLAGVDFSPASEAALRLANLIAASAKFTTFHAVNVPAPGWFGGASDSDEIRSLTKEAENQLSAWWQERELPEEIARPVVIPKSLPEAFREMRYEVKPDLVAIGAHGRSGFMQGSLGSFTEAIIRWQFCDVLVVRA